MSSRQPFHAVIVDGFPIDRKCHLGGLVEARIATVLVDEPVLRSHVAQALGNVNRVAHLAKTGYGLLEAFNVLALMRVRPHVEVGDAHVGLCQGLVVAWGCTRQDFQVTFQGIGMKPHVLLGVATAQQGLNVPLCIGLPVIAHGFLDERVALDGIATLMLPPGGEQGIVGTVFAFQCRGINGLKQYAGFGRVRFHQGVGYRQLRNFLSTSIAAGQETAQQG